MGRPKRDIRAAAEQSTTPPDELADNQTLARVAKAEGNNLYSCLLPDQRAVLVELAAQFRNTIWIKRGGYVLVALSPAEQVKGKVDGEIINVVREERQWRKQSYWPKEFTHATSHDDEENDDAYPTMPPSDPEDE